ncbi:hypothetical protein WDU94_011684 [Cyamophila willieti]
MPYMSEETYANKSVYFNEHFKTNLSHTLNYDAVSCQDKGSTDHSFQNPVIERVPNTGDNIYTQLWKVTENRVRFRDENYSSESKGILRRESHRSNDFLEKVNILKQKLNIIDDYKVNTEIYEKSKHLIDADSLEVQTRRSPCPTPTKQIENKRNLIDERHFKFQPTRPSFILGKDQKQETDIGPLNVDPPDSLPEFSEKVVQSYTTIHEEFNFFTNSACNNQSQVVSVVIENTRTPTRSENNIFRNVLSEYKFDPDSIDGIQFDNTNDKQDEILDISLKLGNISSDIPVSLEHITSNAIEEGAYYDKVDDTDTISVDIENNVEENETLDQVNDGTSSDPTTLASETSSSDDTSVHEQMSDHLTPQELENIESTKQTDIIDKVDSEVLKEVKEIDAVAKKLNKTSYDLTTPETSGISSSHSLVESLTPGRENWRLRESDRSKSSSSTRE